LSSEKLGFLLGTPWRDAELPPDAVGIPTMLSKLERKLLYTLARDYASGDGAIVDAGCFLGGSTAALLAGVRDRAEPWTGPPVESYDLFQVEAYTVPKFFADDPRIEVGDSFRDRFDANVAKFDVPHVVHEGDIVEIGWSGGPIDVLFLDVLKTWEVNDAVLRDFFPFLRPGRSVIVHQDYGSGWLPWIPISVELMGDSLRLIDGMEWGSHVFYVAEEIPPRMLETGVARLDLDEKFTLVERAVERSDGWVRGMMEIARTELVYERHGADAALQDLDRIASVYRDHDFVLSFVDHIRTGLETEGTYVSAPAAPPPRGLAGLRQRLSAALFGG
jgi:hypothetical protein